MIKFEYMYLKHGISAFYQKIRKNYSEYVVTGMPTQLTAVNPRDANEIQLLVHKQPGADGSAAIPEQAIQ